MAAASVEHGPRPRKFRHLLQGLRYWEYEGETLLKRRVRMLVGIRQSRVKRIEQRKRKPPG